MRVAHTQNRSTKTGALSARWHLLHLITALEHAGWSDLAHERKGVIAGLRAIVSSVDHLSGEGWTSLARMGQNVSYTPRSMGDARKRLVEMGIIEILENGHVAGGYAVLSRIRVVKSKLVELIRSGRVTARRARQAHAIATRERLEQLPPRPVIRGSRNRKLAKPQVNPVEMASYASSSREGGISTDRPLTTSQAVDNPTQITVTEVRAVLLAAKLAKLDTSTPQGAALARKITSEVMGEDA